MAEYPKIAGLDSKSNKDLINLYISLTKDDPLKYHQGKIQRKDVYILIVERLADSRQYKNMKKAMDEFEGNLIAEISNKSKEIIEIVKRDGSRYTGYLTGENEKNKTALQIDAIENLEARNKNAAINENPKLGKFNALKNRLIDQFKSDGDKMLIAAVKQRDHLLERYEIERDISDRDISIISAVIIKGQEISGGFSDNVHLLIHQLNAVQRQIAELNKPKTENDDLVAHHRNRLIGAYVSATEKRGFPAQLNTDAKSDYELIKKDRSSGKRFFEIAFKVIFFPLGLYSMMKSISERGHSGFWRPKGHDHAKFVKGIGEKFGITRPKL